MDDQGREVGYVELCPVMRGGPLAFRDAWHDVVLYDWYREECEREEEEDQ